MKVKKKGDYLDCYTCINHSKLYDRHGRAIRWWGDTQNVNTCKHKGGEKHDYTY